MSITHTGYGHRGIVTYYAPGVLLPGADEPETSHSLVFNNGDDAAVFSGTPTELSDLVSRMAQALKFPPVVIVGDADEGEAPPLLSVEDIAAGLDEAGIGYTIHRDALGKPNWLRLAGGIIAGPAVADGGADAPGVDWAMYADPEELGDVGG